MKVIVILMTIWILIYENQALMSHQLLAYDCTSPKVNITSYSLNSVKPCIITTSDITTEQKSILVLQKAERITTQVYQCKLIIERDIQHCGMHSHTSEVRNSYSYSVKPFTQVDCLEVMKTGRIHLYHDQYISEIKVNTTMRGRKLVVGKLDSDNDCKGGLYSTVDESWEDVLVYYKYEVHINAYKADVYVESNMIHLRQGLNCDYSLGSCLDYQEGYTFWDMTDKMKCEEKDYEVIYQGLADKASLTTSSLTTMDPIYTAKSDNIMFTIRSRKDAVICGIPGYATDHNRIFIIELTNGFHPFSKKINDGNNLDILTYVNSKFSMLEHHTEEQMSSLYTNIMTDICKIDKKLMETNLVLARLNPQEFASQLMSQPGHTAVVSGEVINIIKCEPVIVLPNPQERCFQEFPVIYNEKKLFMAPVTRILQRKGTEVDCAPILETKFEIGNQWVTVDNKVRETISPAYLSSEVLPKWAYKSLHQIINSGLYDDHAIEKMKSLIYDSSDRRSVFNVVQKIVTGGHPDHQGVDMSHLFDKVDFESKIHKTIMKMYHWAQVVANIASSSFGIYIIFKGLKFLLDTIFHCRILYDIYGWSWKLIGSCWDSITAWLEHKDRKNQNHHDPPNYKEIMLKDVKIIKESDPLPENEDLNQEPSAPEGKEDNQLYPYLSSPSTSKGISKKNQFKRQ